jgi:lipopolysaccharide export system protein LptC
VRRRYIVTILTAIGVVGYLALDDKQQGPTNNTQQAIQQEPDYIIKGLNAQHYNAQGQLDRLIKADGAHHYPFDDSTQLDNPNLTLHQAAQPQWQVSAKKGTLNQDDILELNGRVQVTPLQQNAGAFSLSSPHLSIDLEQQIADTDKPVIISSPSTKLTATGMNLDMVKQQATFKSTVQGTHNPHAQ